MALLNNDDFKLIIARKDGRFDGRFYFGVKTTMIYCRPVCPAKPKPHNILIFRSKAEAEKNGYRPCLRCRPDLAPASKLLDGTANTVSRALRIIENSSGDDLSVQDLAEKVGVTDRHLRRLFDDHLGASPVEIIITQRLHLAKQLIASTAFPISEIAYISGFQSVRRFNEAFKSKFRVTPQMSRTSGLKGGKSELQLAISIFAPYDWHTAISYLQRHACYGIEYVTPDAYRRFVPVGKAAGSVTVQFDPSKSNLRVQLEGIPLSQVRTTLGRIRFLFDTNHNPLHLPESIGHTRRGIRVPGAFDPFEVGVSIILSQLVSTEHARNKLRSLVVRFGEQIPSSGNVDVYAFPKPKVLASAAIEELGVPEQKASAIRAFSTAVESKRIVFDALENFEVMKSRFEEIKGIGPWTSELLAMRCLGDPDAFPVTDLIVKRAIQNKEVDQKEWHSKRAYLTHLLWRYYRVPASKSNKEKVT